MALACRKKTWDAVELAGFGFKIVPYFWYLYIVSEILDVTRGKKTKYK